jgi:DNA-binding NtrC family response regulator
MLPGPPELEIRYRRFLEGKGDAVAPLFCYMRGDGGARAGTGAWAALIVSRIFLLKGNLPLAHFYLRLAAALSGTARRADSPGGARSGAAEGATLRLGILVNKALILKAHGKTREAAGLLGAVVDRALREGEIYVAAKAASNLALCMARGGGEQGGAKRCGAVREAALRDDEASDARSYLGIAEKYYSAVGCESGLLRAGMTRALLDARQGLLDEAIDRLCVVTGACAGERNSREKAVGLLLVAELSLARADRERAREALDGVAAMRETLERFGPQRLMWLRLESEFNGRSGKAYGHFEGGGAGAASVAREAAPQVIATGERGAASAGPRVIAVRGRGAPSKEPCETFITCDPRMAELLEEIERAARLSLPILIEGESGTGKDLIARLIHGWSGRDREPFVPVNAAALPADLFESIAFGHARGAFTGAVENRAGLAAAAGRGTLFLDEIGELSPAVQAKLLRLIDRREYIPLGETKPRAFEARVVAATNRDLGADCASGRLRADLYYRLAPLVFRIPPLRERPADIELLARNFADRLWALHGIGQASLHESALAALARHTWPGNARELESEILRGALAAKGKAIRACHLSPPVMMGLARGASPAGGASSAGYVEATGYASPPGDNLAARMNAVERDGILEALRVCGGNRTNAARRLGLKRTTLLSAMRRLGIEY